MGTKWSSGIVCNNVIKFLDPKQFQCTFGGFRAHWFIPSDRKYDIMFLQNANRLQARQIWKLRKIRDHIKAETRLTCGVRGVTSFKESESVLQFFDAVECANKKLLNRVKPLNFNTYLGRSGVDTEMFKPMEIKKPEKVTIGFAGSKYRPVKNFDAIQKLGYPILVASKQESFELQKMQYGQVRWSGFMKDPYASPDYWPYEKMPIFHNSYHIYVCASKHEGGPNPVLEAAATGRAIVSTNVAWIPELLEPEWIVEGDPEDDPEAFNALKDKVDRLASDPDLRRKVGERNRKTVKKWDWHKIIKEWEIFFKMAWETRKI